MEREKANAIAQELIRAAQSFARNNPYLQEGKLSWSVWWYQVPQARDVFRSGVQEVVNANPEQLSFSDTEHALTYSSLGGISLSALALDTPNLDKAKLEQVLSDLILELVNKRTSRRLEFLVENVVVNKPAPPFFNVEFVRVSDDDLQRLYKETLVPRPKVNAMAFARVEAPGDSTMAFRWGVRQVERYLNLLRGCGMRFLLGGRVRPLRLVDRNPVDERTAYRELGQYGASGWTMRFAPFEEYVYARVHEDLLSCLEGERTDTLVSATKGPTTELLEAAVRSLETLGEACKPNSNTTKILLVSSAFEMLLGYDSGDHLAFRGQTAALCERAAFIVGGPTAEGHKEVDRRVRDLYGKGSGVRHGRNPDVSENEIGELASITQKVAVTILDRANQWKKPADIDKWLSNMRNGTGSEEQPD